MRAATLDWADRREVYGLLDRLPPARRVAFLRWACTQAVGPGGHAVRVTSHSGTAWEAYQDLLLLEFQHGLDLGRAVERLVALVRRL
jgi:hypothetical protein